MSFEGPEQDFETELKLAVDNIFQACPNFRILILGRSGVGKSNLVNGIFGDGFAIVEHGRKAGVNDIEKEITSPKNPRLILHDSQGFSHGSGDNIKIVKDFIKDRGEKTKLKDKLHAIWLCSAVPTHGASLLEVGEEQILEMDSTVPIVAVFTKYDMLVETLKPQVEVDFYGDIEKDIEDLENGVNLMGSKTGSSASETTPEVLSLAEEKLNNIIAPFEEKLGVPWVKVSVRPGFSNTLDNLVAVTQERINNSLDILWASTQQQSVALKIKASIDMGKKRYWRGLSTSLELACGGKSLEKWFKMIHKDIITIWGMYDPDNVFTLVAAKKISELQDDLVDLENSSMVQGIGVKLIPAIGAGVTAVCPPAAPVAIPIAASLVFALWIYNATAVTPNVLRGMMGYIVDFTIVMQSLFFLMKAREEVSGSRPPVDERLFNLALEAYNLDTEHSPEKVHGEIHSFATRTKALFKSETVIKEVERLINDHRFKPSERFVKKANEGGQ